MRPPAPPGGPNPRPGSGLRTGRRAATMAGQAGLACAAAQAKVTFGNRRARMIEVPDDFLWPALWKPLPLPEGWLGLVRSAEAELQREVGPGHPLFGAACRDIAYNANDVNEFLFVTDSPAA